MDERMHGMESMVVDTYLRGRSRHEPAHGAGHLEDTDAARRMSCCVSLLFISTEQSRHVLALFPFILSVACVLIGPLGWNKLLVHVAFSVSSDERTEETLCNFGV